MFPSVGWCCILRLTTYRAGDTHKSRTVGEQQEHAGKPSGFCRANDAEVSTACTHNGRATYLAAQLRVPVSDVLQRAVARVGASDVQLYAWNATREHLRHISTAVVASRTEAPCITQRQAGRQISATVGSERCPGRLRLAMCSWSRGAECDRRAAAPGSMTQPARSARSARRDDPECVALRRGSQPYSRELSRCRTSTVAGAVNSSVAARRDSSSSVAWPPSPSPGRQLNSLVKCGDRRRVRVRQPSWLQACSPAHSVVILSAGPVHRLDTPCQVMHAV